MYDEIKTEIKIVGVSKQDERTNSRNYGPRYTVRWKWPSLAIAPTGVRNALTLYLVLIHSNSLGCISTSTLALLRSVVCSPPRLESREIGIEEDPNTRNGNKNINLLIPSVKYALLRLYADMEKHFVDSTDSCYSFLSYFLFSFTLFV